jgi:hypothetical protein
MQIACGLQRHFRENGYADLNIFTDAWLTDKMIKFLLYFG